MPLAYTQKVIISGNHVEVYNYENPIWRGYSPNQKKEGEAKERTPEEQQKYEEKKIQTSMTRARNEIKRLVNANPQLNKFLTLTFKDDVKDFDEANYRFNQFIKRMTYRFPNFQYLVVPEIQKESRDVIHYHLLMNLPFVEFKKLTKIWGEGFIWINRIKDTKNVRGYLTKYLSKDMFSPVMKGRKKYFRSTTLRQPKEHLGGMADFFSQAYLSKESPVYESEYMSDWAGRIKYKAYKLKFEPPQNKHSINS